ncbi:MAG: branched-chain amino acid ABC transporter permease [Firmicutes bacterium]|nr:branched-chain amino acid ABC transporter permease [Bacillota bacterium]
MDNKLSRFLTLTGLSLLILAVSGALIFTGLIDEYTAQILTLAGINTIIALSLNLISGFTGQLALGHAGFMAIGGYTTAILIMKTNYAVLQQNPVLWYASIGVAILIGGLVTAIFGLAIGFPTLRLKGDYLAIVTLGFGEIIRVLMVNMEDLTGGAAGLKGIPQFTEDPLWGSVVSFLWITGFMILTVILISNLIKSSHGRAIVSIREDEIAANSMGINVFYYKMFSFTLSAFIAGIGGGLYALFFGYMNPTMFNFLKSLDFLVIVVLGGMGSIVGTVVTGYVLTYLQEFLRFLKDYRLVIYPLILIIIMLFKPTGLIGIIEDFKDWIKKPSGQTNESPKGGAIK